MLSAFARDVRHALRRCRREPGFTAVAAATLGLAVGTASGVFSLVDAVILRPLKVKAPHELVAVLSPAAGGGGLSYPDFLDLREERAALADLAAYTWSAVSVEEGGAVREAEAFFVSEGYFPLLGVGAAQGRLFLPGPPRAQGVADAGGRFDAVLSHDYWRARYDSDPSVVGRVLKIKGRPYTVVGVAAEGFTGTLRGYRAELFLPLTAAQPEATLANRAARGLVGLGRLRPGVTFQAAQGRLALAARRLALAHPDTNRAVTVRVTPERDAFLPDAGPVTLLKRVFAGLFGLVLVIACVNLASLLLARGLFRRKELALRAAIGARRADLVRKLMAESLVLALLGGGLGLLVAVAVRDGLWRWGGAIVAGAIGQRGLWIEPGIDPRTFAFTFALALGSVVLFGLFPALRLSAANVFDAVKAGAHETSPQVNQRPVRLLVAGQVALSVVLLVCAGLFLRSVASAWREDPGHPTRDLYGARLALDAAGYDAPRKEAFQHALLARLEARPEVLSASLSAAGWPHYLPASAFPGKDRHVVVSPVSPGSFRTLGVPLRAGRDFTPADAAQAPRVAIVNQLLADRLWPGQGAIGQALRAFDDAPPLTVVGLVKTLDNPIGPPFPLLYVPLAQSAHWGLSLDLRLRPGTPSAAALVEDAVRAIGPSLPPVRVFTFAARRAEALSALRLASSVLAWLGGMALLLAAVGLSGLTGYVVAERTREVGIRKALGATRRDVLALVLGGTLRLVAVGLGAGAVLGLGAGQVVKSLVTGSVLDPAVLLGVPLLLAATAAAAAYVPARRALALDPMQALRSE